MAIGSIVNRVVLSYRRLFPAFPDKQTSRPRARHFRNTPETDIAHPQPSQRSLHIKLQPLLGSHLFGPRLIDIGSDELVQRPDDLLVLVGTTLGSFLG
jgi:hypothetical protein